MAGLPSSFSVKAYAPKSQALRTGAGDVVCGGRLPPKDAVPARPAAVAGFRR